MRRKEARALGLKVYQSAFGCTRDGGRLRTTFRNQCVVCLEKERQQRKAIADRAKAQTLKTARAGILRELAAEQRKQAKAEEKAAKLAALRAEKEAAERERRKAQRAANKAAAQALCVAAQEAQESSPVGSPQLVPPCAPEGLEVPPWEVVSAPAAVPCFVPVPPRPLLDAPPWD
ncbi:hypothetical protein [Ideonella sp. B508-1]|uniref:hypothetical protein n=1 Tax=Ideonella sp. B508-1 TaxID=137716 RepID=UPI00034B4768|nr:hypothetical protein [Ideonella sp. B508-1]